VKLKRLGVEPIFRLQPTQSDLGIEIEQERYVRHQTTRRESVAGTSELLIQPSCKRLIHQR